MPKQVDHQQRREEISSAVWRLATSVGLQGVTFREVAAEAGVSVSLIQHYFGTKEGLLVWSVDHNTRRMGARITRRLRRAGTAPAPHDVVRIVCTSFLPTDRESREAMGVYHAFAGAALTDPVLRGGDGFRNEAVLRDFLAAQLESGRDTGTLVAGIDPVLEARALLSMVLGLSLAVLLGRVKATEAVATVEHHVDRLFTG